MQHLKGTFDVKLGKSFREPSTSQRPSYMTMRYDFMPASVDRTQPGSIQVLEDEDDDGGAGGGGGGKDVRVDFPSNSSGVGPTRFRGCARPVQKECILIYNKRTGEMVLERVAHSVQLKKTRDEESKNSTTQRSSPVESVAQQPQSATDKNLPSPLASRTKPVKPVSNSSTRHKPTLKSGSIQKLRTLSSSSSSNSTNSDDEIGVGTEHVSIGDTNQNDVFARGDSAPRVEKVNQETTAHVNRKRIGNRDDRDDCRSDMSESNTMDINSDDSLSSLSDDDNENAVPIKSKSPHKASNSNRPVSTIASSGPKTASSKNLNHVPQKQQEKPNSLSFGHRKLIEHDLKLSDSDSDSD